MYWLFIFIDVEYEPTSSESESNESSDEDSNDSDSSEEDSDSSEDIVVHKRKPLGRGKGLFKDEGVLPTRKDQCKNCKEPYADNYKCDNKSKHLRCANCNLLFPDRPQFEQ